MTKRTGGRGIERKWVEVRLGLLKPDLPRGSFGRVISDQRSDGELRKGHRGDEGLSREVGGIGNPLEEDHRAGIEDAPLMDFATHHSA